MAEGASTEGVRLQPMDFLDLVTINGPGNGFVHFTNVTNQAVHLLNAGGEAIVTVHPAERVTRSTFNGVFYAAHMGNQYKMQILRKREVFFVEDGFVIVPDRETVEQSNKETGCVLCFCFAIFALLCLPCALEHTFEELKKVDGAQTRESMLQLIQTEPSINTGCLVVYGQYT